MIESVYQFLQRLGYPHPLHPAIVHIPIGTVIAAVLLGYLALLFRRPKLAQCARSCTLIAFVFSIPTILIGIMDWQHFYSGAWLFPIKAKLILAGALFFLLIAALILGLKTRAESKAILTVYTLCLGVVVALGYFGGDLVYGGRTAKASVEFQAGEKLFASNCNACHPGGGNTIVATMPLRSSRKLQNFESFSAFIRDPKMPDGNKGIMPPFPEAKISAKEANELYQYIENALVK